MSVWPKLEGLYAPRVLELFKERRLNTTDPLTVVTLGVNTWLTIISALLTVVIRGVNTWMTLISALLTVVTRGVNTWLTLISALLTVVARGINTWMTAAAHYNADNIMLATRGQYTQPGRPHQSPPCRLVRGGERGGIGDGGAGGKDNIPPIRLSLSLPNSQQHGVATNLHAF